MIIIVTAGEDYHCKVGDDHHCQVGHDHHCRCWWWLSLSSWGRSMIIIVTAGEDHHCQVGGDRQVGCRQFQHWRWQWGNIFAFSHLVPLFLKLLRALPLSGTVKPELLVISIYWAKPMLRFQYKKNHDTDLAVGGAGLGTTGSLTTILPSPGSFNSAATTTTLPSSPVWVWR